MMSLVYSHYCIEYYCEEYVVSGVLSQSLILGVVDVKHVVVVGDSCESLSLQVVAVLAKN